MFHSLKIFYLPDFHIANNDLFFAKYPSTESPFRLAYILGRHSPHAIYSWECKRGVREFHNEFNPVFSHLLWNVSNCSHISIIYLRCINNFILSNDAASLWYSTNCVQACISYATPWRPLEWTAPDTSKSVSILWSNCSRHQAIISNIDNSLKTHIEVILKWSANTIGKFQIKAVGK